MIHYVADLVNGDDPIEPAIARFHRMAERVLGPGYDFTFERFPHKAHTWQLYAELDKPERRGHPTFVSFNELPMLEVPSVREAGELPIGTRLALEDAIATGIGATIGGRHVPHLELLPIPPGVTAIADMIEEAKRSIADACTIRLTPETKTAPE